MKKVSVLLMTLCLSAMLCAQDNYEQGYIITNRLDTIVGLINLRTNKNNQKQCEFKSDLNLPVKIYLPEDIVGYRFTNTGKYYVSREIKLNETPQKVFLEFLVKGIMNLYYYEDEIDYYFFENQDGTMEVISREPGKVKDMIVYEDYKYVGRIRNLFRDYQSISQKADKLKFNQKSMIGVVKEYHNEVCTTGESCIIFQNEHPDQNELKFKISVYTGLQLSNYTFYVSNEIFYAFEKEHIATQTVSNVSPVLGAQINLLNPRWSKSFSLQLDASLSLFKGDLSGIHRYDGLQRIPLFELLAPSGRLGVKYTYPKYKISPTVEAGIAYTYLKNLKEKVAVTPYEEIHGVGLLRHSFWGYYLAVGADYRIRTNQAVFVRLVYENYPFRDALQHYGKDKISLPHIKIGYTF